MLNTNNLILSLVIIPLLGASVCSLGKILSNQFISKASVIITLLLSFTTVVLSYRTFTTVREVTFIAGGWQPVAGILMGFDMLSWTASLLVLIICTCGIIFAMIEDTYSPMFYFTFLIMLAGMQGVLITRDFFNLFVFFEILAICSYILIAYFQKSHSVLASFKYLIIGSAAMVFYLIGVFIIYQNTGSVAFSAINDLNPQQMSPTLAVAIIALVIGIGVRTAFIPFHTWLPEAHAYAPHPVSAILSGVMIKVAFIALWRVLDLSLSPVLLTVFLFTGTVTALLGACYALSEIDAKKILAFSSVSQMGYLIAALGIGSTVSRTAALYHAFNHGIFKCLLFLSVGTMILLTGERNIKKLRGIAKSFPLLSIFYLTAALSIAGIPPFSGFVSKKTILNEASGYSMHTLLWIASFVTFAAYFKLSLILTGKKTKSVETSAVKPIRFFYLPIGFLSLLTLIMGLLPQFWLNFFSFAQVSSTTIEPYPVYTTGAILGILPVIVAGITIFLLSKTNTGNLITNRIRRIVPSLSRATGYLLAAFVLATILLWR
ncbi:proton-conducting transporter membrane subunit [Chitinispirillales bacterium ANBcel5]|uniref:complex I subunit 5 family protein n=1 Tax=Cellulosispirillum alkaliphilum TaxID=3039283 RepID=UPI002A53E5D6|nr:proton-conducting transporter membrane subunit [Chitinispirillales bacterium ANBcel5]